MSPRSNSTSESRDPDLLLTKLAMPPLHRQLVARPELLAQLDEGQACPLTLVSAPAGFGKTTILSAWIAQTKTRIAWLSLDDADNDLTRFWHYVTAALERVESGVAVSAQMMLRAPQPLPIEHILTALINDIVLDSEEVALVLDDYHVIGDPAIHHSLTFLLDHMPPNMHLVIAARSDPPLLPLSRLRARGELVELRVADLRFTPCEAAEFLNEVMDLALTPEDVAALEQRTEGWIAGLQLAAISMRGRGDYPAFIRAFTGSNRFVLDYLSDQVLQQQSEQVRDFLVQTSILERLNAPLCSAVTGIRTSQTILEGLERQNLFVIALDDERDWYRYHHLFADVLQHRLRQSQPERVSELHHRASVWYESQDLLDEAIAHVLSAGDGERAAQLVEQRAEILIERAQIATLLRCLQVLPDYVIRTRPKLCAAYAMASLSTGQPEAVEPWLQEAERAAATAPREPRPGTWLGETDAIAKVIRGTLAFVHGDTTRTLELSQQALAQLGESALFVRNLAAWNLGNAYWQNGDLDRASETFAELATPSRTRDDPHMSMLAHYYLAWLQSEHGQLREAFATHEQALRAVSGSHPAASYPLGGKAELLREWNDLDAALRYVTQAIELGKQAGSVIVLLAAYETLAWIKQAQGELVAAFEAIDQAEHLFEVKSLQNPAYRQILAHRAQLWLWQADLEAASRWAREVGLRADDEPEQQREREYITLARLLLARGEPQSVLDLLARLLHQAQLRNYLGCVIQCFVLESLAHHMMTNRQQARLTLARAVSLAEPGGYIRTFVDEGEPIRLLLADMRLHIEKGTDHRARESFLRYIDTLLAAFGHQGGTILTSAIGDLSYPARPAATPHMLVEPLSEREFEVLKLIADGLSNREIANRLFVEIGTVKTHINNIYGKLNIHSRTQAIARARDLHLL